jgi:hypothetical protein
MKNRESERTLVTLANGAALVQLISTEVLGEELASSISTEDGPQALNRDVLLNLATVKFQAHLSPNLEK